MLPKINPTTTNSWQLLQHHFSEMKNVKMKDLFHKEPERFKKYSLQIEDIIFDYSKNRISDQTLELLLQLAEECKVRDSINAMFSGAIINETEHRSVLHTALRNFFRSAGSLRRKRRDAGNKKIITKNKNILQCNS